MAGKVSTAVVGGKGELPAVYQNRMALFREQRE